LSNLVAPGSVWDCPAARASTIAFAEPVLQRTDAGSNAPAVRYWMWRFDRTDDPVVEDNFWGRTEVESYEHLVRSGNPNIGQPNGPGDVELSVDVYFPRTVPSVPDGLKGRTPHAKGRNRLLLDGHAEFLRDPRTPSG
jgi:prepilin-type processing-associated H-X9-DG protein